MLPVVAVIFVDSACKSDNVSYHSIDGVKDIHHT